MKYCKITDIFNSIICFLLPTANKLSVTVTCAVVALVLFLRSHGEVENVASKKPKHSTPGKKMKAIIIIKYGSETMEYREDYVNMPKLKQSSSDILIQVKAASLNPVDLMIGEGKGKVMYNKMRMAKGVSYLCFIMMIFVR